MLNRSSPVPNARGLGRFRQVAEAMKPATSMQRPALRRWPGRRLREEAEGVLLMVAILVAVCAFLLLLDRLGVPPAAMTDFPLVD